MHTAHAILNAELSNILASQKYAESRNDQVGWEMCRDLIHGGMAYYFNLHAMWSDWISWSHTGIQACQKLKDERSAISIASSLGMVYQRKGDWDQAIEFYKYALTEVERMGNLQGAATVYMNLGITQTQKGEWPEAVASLDRSLELSEQLGDRLGMARARANLGMLHSKQGEKTKARALWAQALELLQAVNAQNEADIVRKWLRSISPTGRL